MKNIVEKAKQVHQDNVDKGFWDGKTPESRTVECLALIHGEVSEALEAHRKNRWANLEQFKIDQKSWKDNFINHFKTSFENHIKDTVEDELADTAIRVLDLIGALDMNELVIDIFNGKHETEFHNVEFSYIVNELHNEIVFLSDRLEIRRDSGKDKEVIYAFDTLISMFYGIGKYYNIDLEKHIDLKLEYNKLRAYKHGKTY